MHALFLVAVAIASAAVPEVKLETRGLQIGEAALVVVTDQDAKTTPTGSFNGKDLTFYASGATGTYLAWASVDLEATPGQAKLIVDLKGADGTPRHWEQTLTVANRVFPTRRLTVDPRYVNPSPADEARAEAESARAKKIFATVTPERLWDGKFSSPIPGAVVSRFGERSVFNNVPKAPHSGADLRAKEGVPVKASARGRVMIAENFYYSGNFVVLDHGYGVYSSYSHLSRIDVAVNDVLTSGQVLGAVGATGRVTGAHLHWAVKVGEARVDPFSLVDLPLDAYR